MAAQSRITRGAAVGAGLALASILVSPIASAAPRQDPPVPPVLGWSAPSTADAQALAATLNVAPGALSAYSPFTQPFPGEWADAAKRDGVPLVLAWEPWDWNLPVGQDQPQYALARIASGAHDDYVRAWASAAARSGARILLRFAPEMNGDWNPWSIGDSPADFRAAWRHLHRLFAEAGATNVRWVFNPSVAYSGSTPISDFWPGTGLVDWVGLDGYNWKGVLAGRGYQSVTQVFSDSIAQLRALAPRLPLMIAECAAGPAAKDQWVPDLVRTAPALGVSLVVWFEHVKETDWRLETTHLSRPLATLLAEAGWRTPGTTLPGKA